jgi:ATPase subunit of ABC transporter with duplicated ATPase domains
MTILEGASSQGMRLPWAERRADMDTSCPMATVRAQQDGLKRSSKGDATGMASVEIRDAEKGYGATRVIHRVFRRHRGRRVRDPGRLFGCGESTLLRMIAGIENIAAGEVRISARCQQGSPSTSLTARSRP